MNERQPRLDQIARLLAATIAVVLTGQSALTSPANDSQPIQPYDLGPLSGDSPFELLKAVAYVGLFTRVAEQEGLSVGHVVQVAKGKRTSKRVISAIIHEVRRIEQRSGCAA